MFIWPDSYNAIALIPLLLLIPVGVFSPVYGTIQLACVFFVELRFIRRYRRRPKRGEMEKDGSAALVLVCLLIAGYLVTVGLTNLALFVLMELGLPRHL